MKKTCKRLVSFMLFLAIFANAICAQGVAFSDVPETHWAKPAIEELSETGIMGGVGNNLFAPEKGVTYAEFIAMVVRTFYNEKIKDAESDSNWYSPYINVADTVGIYRKNELTNPNALISRYDMAFIVDKVLWGLHLVNKTSVHPNDVSDWYEIPQKYLSAITSCYYTKILTGIDSKGTFSGKSNMTRAQAAVVLLRLINFEKDKKEAEKNSIPSFETAAKLGLKNCEVGKQYSTESGYGVTIEKAEVTNIKGVRTFVLKYTLKNLTEDKYLDEKTFHFGFKDGTATHQGGIYLDGMYPGDTITKTFKLNIEDKEISYVMFNDGDFFLGSPKAEFFETHLVWYIK